MNANIKADLIVKNAAVYSVTLDNREIRGDALAVAGGKILYVGNEKEAMEFADSSTEIVDAGGNTLLPGLGDGHSHADGTGGKMLIDLSDIVPAEDDTPDTIVEKYCARLKKYIDEHPGQERYECLGWDAGYFNGSIKGVVRELSRKDLDAVCPDIPVVMTSYCGHHIWVNTKALERAGWARSDFPDLKGGTIYREEDGFPSGHITEPALTSEFKKQGNFLPGLENYVRILDCFQYEYGVNDGLTMSGDMKTTEVGREALLQYAKAGKLHMRLSYVYSIDPGTAEADFAYACKRVANDQYEDLVFNNTLKFFIEGEISNLEPNLDSWCDSNGVERGYIAPLLWDLDNMYKYMDGGVKKGFNIHIHAMGSNAVYQAAKLCAKCRQANPDKNVTYTIAHNMAVTPETMKIMADNGIFANLQAVWMYFGLDTDLNYPSVSKEPENAWFPNKSFEDAGVRVAYGTDFPVTAGAKPLFNLCCALTRSINPCAKEYESYKGTSYRPDECVTFKQAVKALTVSVAAQFGIAGITGSLEVGKSADFVILDRNIEKIEPIEIYGVNVLKTYFKGEKVFEK